MGEKLPLHRLRELRLRRRRYGLLEDWYGREFAETEIAAHTGEPRPVAQAVSQLMEQVLTPETNAFIAISKDWNATVGPALAKLVRPQRLENGTLYLEVRHSALMRELAPSLDLILQKIRQQQRAELCKAVKLVISGAGSPHRR